MMPGISFGSLARSAFGRRWPRFRLDQANEALIALKADSIEGAAVIVL